MTTGSDSTARFYRAIADHYDEIFPFDEEMAAFLVARFARARNRLLDLGCATGTLALGLARRGFAVTGIDTATAMLAQANAAARADRLPATFEPLDLRSFGNRFTPAAFDGAYCVGNTLAHLPDAAAIADVCAQTARLLAPAGIFAIQIINYDRILDQRVPGLPTIETGAIRFERAYRPVGPGEIRFVTRLTIKATGATVANDIPLVPLRAAALTAILAAAGFAAVETFGEYDGSPWTPASPLTIAVATKHIRKS